MDTVEAAASLFGSEDPSSDVFSVLGHDVTNTPAPQESHHVVLGDNGSAPCLFNPGQGSEKLFADTNSEMPFDSLTETAADSSKYDYSQEFYGESDDGRFFDQVSQEAGFHGKQNLSSKGSQQL
jgi:hypothetical protein